MVDKKNLIKLKIEYLAILFKIFLQAFFFNKLYRIFLKLNYLNSYKKYSNLSSSNSAILARKFNTLIALIKGYPKVLVRKFNTLLLLIKKYSRRSKAFYKHYLNIANFEMAELLEKYLMSYDNEEDIEKIINFLNMEKLYYFEKQAWILYLSSNHKKIDVADKLIENIGKINKKNISGNRNLAVQLFIREKYQHAIKIWDKVEKYRLKQIRLKKLDHHEIRFLSSHWFIAIGHIAHLDSYFKYLHLNSDNRKKFVPYLNPSIQTNKYLLSLWRDYFVNESEIWSNVDKFSDEDRVLLEEDFWSLLLPDLNQTKLFNVAGGLIQRRWHEEGQLPLISIENIDRERGWKTLFEYYNIRPDQWFVVLHVRESGFHQKWHDSHPGIRNSNIDTYSKAVEEVISRGGIVIRVGDRTMKPIKKIPGYYDYAHSDIKSDFMDIFLCAECKFFIGTNSGLSLVPPIFGKRCALTNWVPLAIPQWYPKDLVIFKLIKDKFGKLIKFNELLSSEIGWAQFEKNFEKKNLTVIDNTEDEIRQLVVELIGIIFNTISYSQNDLNLKIKFKSLLEKKISYSGSEIGRDFINKYQYLLD